MDCSAARAADTFYPIMFNGWAPISSLCALWSFTSENGNETIKFEIKNHLIHKQVLCSLEVWCLSNVKSNKCANWEMEAYLPSKLFGLHKYFKNITNPNPTRQVVLYVARATTFSVCNHDFFAILLQPCHSTLAIPPSPDKTGAVYLLQRLDGNTIRTMSLFFFWQSWQDFTLKWKPVWDWVLITCCITMWSLMILLFQ